MELLFLLLTVCVVLGVTATALAAGFALGLIYACSSYCDRTELEGGRPWKAMRRWRIWHWTLGLWCPVEVVYDEGEEGEEELEENPNQPILWAHHPHGVWPTTMPLAWGLGVQRTTTQATTTDVKRHRIAVTRILFWIPFVADIAKWIGCIDAGGGAIRAALDQGHHVHLTPGGVKEVLLAEHRTLEMDFTHRGFLRLAWGTGTPIRPVFDADETAVYRTWRWPTTIRTWTTRVLGWPIPTLFLGPLPCRLRSCVGRTIQPTIHATLEAFSAAYYAELFRLIRRHRRPDQAFGPALQRAMDAAA